MEGGGRRLPAPLETSPKGLVHFPPYLGWVSLRTAPLCRMALTSLAEKSLKV